MRKALLATLASLLALSAFASDASVNPAFRRYVEAASRVCPDSQLTIDKVDVPGPKNFTSFKVTQKSSGEYCSGVTYAMMSFKSGQILIGQVYTLHGSGSLETRISERVSKMMGMPAKVHLENKSLEDGLKMIDLTVNPTAGAVTFPAWLDASGKFMIIGRRGHLGSDPGEEVMNEIGIDHAVRRGARDGKVHIVEISDLECPMCKHAHQTLEPFFQKHKSQITWSRLDLPLVFAHEWTLKASRGALAIEAVAPDQYWNYVNYIFGNQDWLNQIAIDSAIEDFCTSYQVDWKKVEPVYHNEKNREFLLAQVGRMFGAGIFATPTLYVNGRQVYFGRDGSFFLQYVNSLLKGSGK